MKAFEDEQIIWTTQGNESLQNKAASELLFEGGASIRPITLGFEAKEYDPTEPANVLTM